MCDGDNHDLLLLIIQTQRIQGKMLSAILQAVGLDNNEIASLTSELRASHDSLQQAIDANTPK